MLRWTILLLWANTGLAQERTWFLSKAEVYVPTHKILKPEQDNVVEVLMQAEAWKEPIVIRGHPSLSNPSRESLSKWEWLFFPGEDKVVNVRYRFIFESNTLPQGWFSKLLRRKPKKICAPLISSHFFHGQITESSLEKRLVTVDFNITGHCGELVAN
jgi:hypothetical protein